MVFDKNKSLIEQLQDVKLEPKKPRKKKKKKSTLKPFLTTLSPEAHAFIRKNKKAILEAAISDLVYIKLCKKGQPDRVLKMDMNFKDLIK